MKLDNLLASYKWAAVLAVVVLVVVGWEGMGVFGCNEAVCASIVSKCQLTESCKCGDFARNRSCSRDCHQCLDYLYHDCCSCVQMCPKPNTTDTPLASKSHVENLPEPQPELFEVLTEQTDHLLRWTSHTIPTKIVFMDITSGSNVNGSGDGVDTETDVPVNCTVAYMSQCMSWTKCKSSCASMGASSYRWFHDKCCQCVGQYCINYGIKESQCLQCPLTHDDGYEPESATDDSDYTDGSDDTEEESEDKNETKPTKNIDKSVKSDGQSVDKKTVVEDITTKSSTGSDGQTK